MKNILIIMLAFLCSITTSAQRNNKVELKAKSYAEKYERVGNELTISIVVDKISMSRKEIYAAFPELLEKQFKIREDDIEERDPLGNSIKCSTILKITDAATATIKTGIEMKLSAKDKKRGELKAESDKLTLDMREHERKIGFLENLERNL